MDNYSLRGLLRARRQLAWWLSQMASSTQPTVLRFQFPSAKQSEDGLSNGRADADCRISRAIESEAQTEARHMTDRVYRQNGLQRAEPIYAQSIRHWLRTKPCCDAMLEPANPFDGKAARPPRRWFVLFCLVSALVFGCFSYFNNLL